MEAAAYSSLRNLQDRHWWFVGRRTIIASLIRRLVSLPQRARILEAGCGYGGNLPMLERFGDLDAFEFAEEARTYASARMARPVAHGELPHAVGFDGERFDLIAMLDVLEHIDDDLGSLVALRNRLDQGGSIVLTVPALPCLWSDHDTAHHHKRRYSRRTLDALLRRAGFEPVRVGYFNTFLFPLALVQRLVSRIAGGRFRGDAMPSRSVNAALGGIFALEARLVGRVALPIGLSLFAVARPVEARR